MQKLPAEHLGHLGEMLATSGMRSQAKYRLKLTTFTELTDTLYFDLPEEVGDRFIDLYVASNNFHQANDWGRHISLYASDFNASQQKRLICEISKNGEVMGSFEISKVIAALRRTNKIPRQQFEELLIENSLEAFKIEQKV